MSYKVLLSPQAAKSYKKLDASIKPTIQKGLDALTISPLNGPQIKDLKGRLRDYLRLRISHYRIIYTVDKKGCTVYVDYIQHRKDVYR